MMEMTLSVFFKERKGQIKLAVLDVIMPGKNGLEAFRDMRKMDGGLKAIFVSGYNRRCYHG